MVIKCPVYSNPGKELSYNTETKELEFIIDGEVKNTFLIPDCIVKSPNFLSTPTIVFGIFKEGRPEACFEVEIVEGQQLLTWVFGDSKISLPDTLNHW